MQESGRSEMEKTMDILTGKDKSDTRRGYGISRVAIPTSLISLLFFALLGCGDSGTDYGLDASFADSRPEVDSSFVDSGEFIDGFVQDGMMTDAEPVPSHDPDGPGPYGLDSIEATVTRDGRNIPVKVYIPQKSEGERSPVIVFVPGFQLESNRYDALAQRVASHGFVYIRSDPPASLFSVSHVAMAADVSAVLDWALDTSGPIAAEIDSSSIGAMGHSLGGKVSTMAAHRDSRITALFGIDPVNDGGGPMGYSENNPDILPHELQNATIPVGFAGETVNATAGGLGQACAPEGKNFIVFYESAVSAPWRAMWDFLGANHMDFVDDTSGCSVCGLCDPGTADPDEVSASLRTLASAFFRRHFFNETAMEQWLTGSLVPQNIDVVHSP